MLFGFFSMIESIRGEFLTAAWAIVGASIFDGLDGRIARLAKATSSFGVEYDSLSDLVSFGMAPTLLVYLWLLEPYGRLGWLASFLFLVCGALRLARFNVTSSVLPKAYFQGLPIPIAAGVMTTFVIFQNALKFPEGRALSMVGFSFVVGLGVLMVSTLPFPSFKEVNWRSKANAGVLMVLLLITIFVAIRPEVTVFLGLLAYVVFSLIWDLIAYFKGTLPKGRISEKEL